MSRRWRSSSEPRHGNSVARCALDAVGDRQVPGIPAATERYVDIPARRAARVYRTLFAGVDIEARLAAAPGCIGRRVVSRRQCELRRRERVTRAAQSHLQVGEVVADEITLDEIGLIEDRVVNVLRAGAGDLRRVGDAW